MIRRFSIGITKRPDLWAIALLSYVPTLAFSSGTYNADTKLYLTSDVSRLMSQARFAWDPSQFAGYVPHQAVGYLWPMGPFYWFFQLLGLPAWLIQRCWVATLFCVASLGVLALCRRAGFSRSASVVGALAYQFTPFVLSYQSRTSAMLLPWVGLPWIILLIEKGTRHRGWRNPALVALVVASVGGINATSLLMIAPGPLIFLADQFFARAIRWKDLLVLILRTAVLSVLVSLWWISMVYLQGRYGSDVLTYSETVEAVSSTSVSTEVFRGLGYWLNYVVSPTYNGTSHALSYLSTGLLLPLSYFVPLAGVAGIALFPSRFRRVSAWWIATGMILAVGVHPLSDSSPLLRVLANRPDSTVSLALRSSTRALPLVLLGFSIGIASMLSNAPSLIRKLGRLVPSVDRYRDFMNVGGSVVAALLVVASVPSRFTTGVGDSSLAHEPIPSYWKEAGDSVTKQLGGNSRALQLPGQEFGAYKWGYTVDPALAAVTRSQIVTRDLLPLGNPQVMDLVNAVDDDVRDGSLNDTGLVEAARLLGVGSIVVPHDLNVERFGTYSSLKIAALVRNLDEERFGDTEGSVSTFAIPRSSIARLEERLTIVEGSGSGVVAAANAGLLHGVVRYANDMTDEEIRSATTNGAAVVVTDSNRVQSQQWRGSLDTTGFSEDGQRSSTTDSADRRLQLFQVDHERSRTIVSQKGTVTASATSYGFPLGYWPEARAALAVDGRTDTAWTTGVLYDPVGQTITLKSLIPLRTLTLRQPPGSRWISAVEVALSDQLEWKHFDLRAEERLLGQPIDLGSDATSVRVRIAGVRQDAETLTTFPDGVGFSEMISEDQTSTEETSVPTRAVSLISKALSTSYVFSRQRAPEESWWRTDPETRLQRRFETSGAADVTIRVTGRLNLARESYFGDIFGANTFAVEGRSSDFSHAGWRATDGDRSTSWKTRLGSSVAPVLRLSTVAPTTSVVFHQCASLNCNAATRVRISDSAGKSIVRNIGNDGHVDTSELVPGTWLISIIQTTARSEKEPRFGVELKLPLEISEIAGDGIVVSTPASWKRVNTPLNLNGSPVCTTTTPAISIAEGTFATTCDVTLLKGHNDIRTINDDVLVDTVSLVPHQYSSNARDTTVLLPMSGTPVKRTITVPPHANPTWFVFGEGYSDGWKASVNGTPLSNHAPVDGGFNGWLVPASSSPSTITLTFAPQRTANMGLLVSLFAAILCLYLVTRRGEALQERTTTSRLRHPSISHAVAGAALLVATTCFAVSARSIALGSLYAVLLLVMWRVRRLPHLAVFAICSTTALAVRRIVRMKPEVDFKWPISVETFHRPLLVAVILFTVIVTLTDHQQAEN